ncbi:MAG TPA: hypothetical protein VM076_04830 [Gemmatimonadaceae bacterium]|nr:hypothetical protein [Gemmatimonadaceae bacterium]
MKLLRLGVATAIVAASSVGAQEPTGASPVRGVIDRARAAMNDLQYPRADSLAREVLALGPRLRRSDRIEALQIVVSANYPEAGGSRNEAAARSAIAEMLKVDLAATMPREMSWPALDSMYRDVSRSTFAVSVSARRDNPIVGIDGNAPIRVRSSRPAQWTLIARTRDGIESVLIDSVSRASDTTLRFIVARGRKPILRGTEYEFVVTATDPQTQESIVRRFDGIALVPSIEFAAIPVTIDSTKLLPERSKSQRIPVAIGGVVLGAATVALGKQLRADAPFKGNGETDTRATKIGIAIAGGSLAAAWFDKGRLLDRNVAANIRTRQDFERTRRAAMAENERRAAEYRASFTLNPEPR